MATLALASLVHGPGSVSRSPDVPPGAGKMGRHASDVPPTPDQLSGLLLPLLRRQGPDLGYRWASQARALLMLEELGADEAQHALDAASLAETLIGGLSDGDAAHEDTIGQGMQFGVTAFRRGVSLHHVLKALDLLMAMMLFSVESTLDQIVGFPETDAADGIRLSRRLQRRGALLSLAATRGYMQAYADALRDRFRHLRHDLRNPLGTIKSVLALMDDDSVPLEARVNPNFRAMATRNARSLEELIAERLGDAAALLPTVGRQSASVRSIAWTVRRDLRAEAENRGVAIMIEEGGPHGQLDAAGLELLLRDALQITLQDCEPGERIHIDFEQPPGYAGLALSRESGRPPIRDSGVLERLNALAEQIGATITAGQTLLLSIRLGLSDAVQPAEQEHSVSRDSGPLGDGEIRHDVRSARESHHGQTGAL